jgi:hypothetical protein
MKNIISVIVIGILTATALPMAANAQDGTSIFVIYGTKYEADNETPEAIDYTVTVEHLSKSWKTTLILGENDGPGKYSVVWVDPMGSMVVEPGEEILVKAEKEGFGVFGYVYEITAADVFANSVMLDIHWEDISADTKTWGAIKSMYK